ncbi:MAG: IclR family transcriptional regulator [Rhodobacteraceae bacterium]|nr:IclR family transcriptional regulator [Paracoccaceae bacterium]
MYTVVKALSLLEHFSDARPTLGLTQVQRLSGRDKATVHRHLLALEECGFVEQDPATRRYRLGHALERLAGMRRRTVQAADTIAPLVDRISREVGELVHVTRLVGTELHQLYHSDLGGYAVRVSLEPDIVLPLLTTSSGKAILAFRPVSDQAAMIAQQHAAFGVPPMPTADAVLPELRQTAARGYARSFDTLEIGVSSVGVPLFDADSRAVAACSIAFPTARRSDSLLRACVAALFRHGGAITERLGGTPPAAVRRIWAEHLQPAEMLP